VSLVSRREESELGAWTQLTLRQEAFAELVECVWLFDGELGRRRERHYPTGELDLIVQLDAPFRIVEGQPAATCPPSFLSGLIVAPLVIENPVGRSRVLGVRLRPAGAFALFGVPLRELTGSTADLQDLVGSESRRLAERLDEAGSDDARLLLLAEWTAERLAERPRTDPRVAHAVSTIERAGGKVPIGDVVRRVGASPRRFTSMFEEQVGVTPKLFSRIVRFRGLAAALRAGAGSFGRLALAHGYYDQSHMNADFTEFAGMPPGRFVAGTPYPETLSSAD
jgi:AraC-like DNA-binding protein